jgi:hypothetical protein
MPVEERVFEDVLEEASLPWGGVHAICCAPRAR